MLDRKTIYHQVHTTFITFIVAIIVVYELLQLAALCFQNWSSTKRDSLAPIQQPPMAAASRPRRSALERDDTRNGYSTPTLELDQPDALDQARELHTRFFIGAAAAGEATALVNMYGRCGERERCQDRLDEMEHRKITHSLNQQCLEALRFFRTMLLEGVRPDSFTFLKSLEKKLAISREEEKERKNQWKIYIGSSAMRSVEN
ncbi:hypothetical protein SELMODRAFT_441370 [Selaginella moellendorffii]|uniref:Uncharacterized protein n=1 Tax=Selaginella moellendorffii TaxID=88036 RepID=D8RJ14_SELML|nr:hypothetical protein SELMODRAFT_441370 [Selaginella moellendorffii]